MSCVSYFVAMCILSPLGRERQMAMPSIAAAPVSVVLNLLLGGPFGAVGAGCAWLLATPFSAGPGVIAIAGLFVYCAVDIAVAVALRDDTTLMLGGKVRAVLRRG